MSIKALAVEVLRGNQRGNQQETKSFLVGKLRKPKRQPGKLEIAIPQWQRDFCLAHGMFNNWRGNCPCSFDDCLISKILLSNGDINKLRGIELGQDINAGHVLDTWLGSGEPVTDLFQKPVWLFCIAEHLANNESVESV